MSEFVQSGFIGGMNLLSCDTDLANNQYRIGFNVRNRYDNLEPTFSSVEDTSVPQGLMQECITFGNYVVLFVGGNAWYRLFNSTSWKRVLGFKMSSTAPRLWTVAVPVATTNYLRLSIGMDPEDTSTPGNAEAGIKLNNIENSLSSAFGGNLPGLLVQDNVNQPQFIYLQSNGIPKARTTQTYAQWRFTWNQDVTLTVDRREYVPIGNCMAWVDGVLYIVSQDFNTIYRSVSGRPLDFVVNVTPDGTTTGGNKGGDATTTSYSVGVGGISCIRGMSDNSLFVGASNANFAVYKNTTPGAPTLWGEYTFIRKFLFNATGMSDRAIIDSLGDTRFIALTGVRSFNAILQTQNEGRNVLFSSMLQSAFDGVIQDASYSAAILYDNYEFYALSTIFGPALAVYDTINQCWSSFDDAQVDGERIKILSKIELSVQRLFAVTENNRFFTLYQSTSRDTARVRTASYSSNDPKKYIKLNDVRVVIDTVSNDFTLTCLPIVDNRYKDGTSLSKSVSYVPPSATLANQLPDINTLLYNAYWFVDNVNQGYKTCCEFSWSHGQVTQWSMNFNEDEQNNPMTSR